MPHDQLLRIGRRYELGWVQTIFAKKIHGGNFQEVKCRVMWGQGVNGTVAGVKV